MKWITPLWSDPVGWSEWMAKTKTRVFVWALIHLCFVLGGLFMIDWGTEKLREMRDIPAVRFISLSAGAFPIVLFGIVYPAFYLYALHRLLLQLKADNGKLK